MFFKKRFKENEIEISVIRKEIASIKEKLYLQNSMLFDLERNQKELITNYSEYKKLTSNQASGKSFN